MAPSKLISLDEVNENRSYIVIIDKGVRYCLTGNEGVYDEDSPYVMLTDRTPTKQKLLNGQIKQKRWIKHPKQGEASPEETGIRGGTWL
jgi:hypothetical protein